MKRTRLGAGAKSLERGSTFNTRGKSLRRSAGTRKSRSISPASASQRKKCRGRACIVCRVEPAVPAHLVDRSLGGCDDPLCTVPLGPVCHRLYDEGQLDLLPFLEPHYRDELAHAVIHLGLSRALHRVTNTRPT